MTRLGRRMYKTVVKLLRNDDGAALIEYGLLVMLIAMLCIIALKTIGSKVANSYNSANVLLP